MAMHEAPTTRVPNPRPLPPQTMRKTPRAPRKKDFITGKAKTELSMKLPQISAPHSKSFTFGSSSFVPANELKDKLSGKMLALRVTKRTVESMGSSDADTTACSVAPDASIEEMTRRPSAPSPHSIHRQSDTFPLFDQRATAATTANNHKHVRKKRIPSLVPEKTHYRATVWVQRPAPKTTSIWTRNKFRLSNIDDVKRAEVL